MAIVDKSIAEEGIISTQLGRYMQLPETYPILSHVIFSGSCIYWAGITRNFMMHPKGYVLRH